MTNTKDWFDGLKKGDVVYWSTNQLPFEYVGRGMRPNGVPNHASRTWLKIRNPRTGREFVAPWGSIHAEPVPKEAGRGQRMRMKGED